ncbi:MAG: hypothetical protein AB1925_26990 [Actinomycetota bacterium]
MSFLDTQSMDDQALKSTADALDNALAPLAHFAIAAGAPRELVRNATGLNITNSSRLKGQKFNDLVAKLNQALLLTSCVPLLDIRGHPSAKTAEVVPPAFRESFVNELIQMADALQRMKYVLLVEQDVRTTTRRIDIATTTSWEEAVEPHLIAADRLSSYIVAEVNIYRRTRNRYVQLAKIGQIPWSSRQPVERELFVAKHRIADLLAALSNTASCAASEASQFECSFDSGTIRRCVSTWRSHGDRMWDPRAMAKANRMFRRTIPSHHPLSDILRPQSQLARAREAWQADYLRSFSLLDQFLERTRSCAKDAAAAQDMLLSRSPRGSAADATIAVNLGACRVLEIHTARTASSGPSANASIPRIVVAIYEP